MTQKLNHGDIMVRSGKAHIWIICPDCKEGRLVIKGNTEHLSFTGRCRTCYLKVAKKDNWPQFKGR